MEKDMPKNHSSELRKLRAEFAEIAAKTKEALGKLDSAIFAAESAERRAELDAVLDEFVPGSKDALKGHDVSFYINKSKDMGEGYSSRIGTAVWTAFSISSAISGHDDVTVSASLFTSGSPSSVNVRSGDRIDRALEKSDKDAKELNPVAKEIMIANTPDKQTASQKHYVIVTDGTVTDSIEHAAQMLEMAMTLNEKVSIDFVSYGDGSGNVAELAKLLQNSKGAERVALHSVEKPEDTRAVVMGALEARFAKKTAAAPAAPKPEKKEEQQAVPGAKKA
jgi:hypothetical protein